MIHCTNSGGRPSVFVSDTVTPGNSIVVIDSYHETSTFGAKCLKIRNPPMALRCLLSCRPFKFRQPDADCDYPRTFQTNEAEPLRSSTALLDTHQVNAAVSRAEVYVKRSYLSNSVEGLLGGLGRSNQSAFRLFATPLRPQRHSGWKISLDSRARLRTLFLRLGNTDKMANLARDTEFSLKGAPCWAPPYFKSMPRSLVVEPFAASGCGMATAQKQLRRRFEGPLSPQEAG